MLSIALHTARVHLITFGRVKQAVFWSFVFPVFLYAVFGSIFGIGGDTEFTAFLLTGILGMTVMADGLFAIGGLVKSYYSNGTLRYLKKLPMSIMSYFGGVILCRFAILIGVLLFLSLFSYFVFGHQTILSDLPPLLPGMIIGLWVFSFIGLSVSFSNMKRGAGGKGLVNILYFIFLFLSNALYPVRTFNSSIGELANYLPLGPILQVMRNEPVNWPVLIFWIVVPPLVFSYFYNRISIQR